MITEFMPRIFQAPVRYQMAIAHKTSTAVATAETAMMVADENFFVSRCISVLPLGVVTIGACPNGFPQ